MGRWSASCRSLTTRFEHNHCPLAGRATRARVVGEDVSGALASQGFIELPITVLHGQTADSLPGPHRDPFDRMLIAQATLAGLVLVSNKAVFDHYADTAPMVKRLGYRPSKRSIKRMVERVHALTDRAGTWQETTRLVDQLNLAHPALGQDVTPSPTTGRPGPR